MRCRRTQARNKWSYPDSNTFVVGIATQKIMDVKNNNAEAADVRWMVKYVRLVSSSSVTRELCHFTSEC